MPESVVKPMACFVSKTKAMVPSSGARTIGSVGVTAAPSPIIPPAKASSGVVERSAQIPVIGLPMMTVRTGVLLVSASDRLFSSGVCAPVGFFPSVGFVPAAVWLPDLPGLFTAAFSSEASSEFPFSGI